MKKKITIHQYGYALDTKDRKYYRTLHYYNIQVMTDSGAYMQTREDYGYQREDYELDSWQDQIECQLYNLSYAYGLILDLLDKEDYDTVEVDLLWGGKPKRAMVVVDNPHSNYGDDKVRKRTFLLDVRRKIGRLKGYVDSGKVTMQEDNAKDKYHLSKVSRDGYKYNKAVALSVNKTASGDKIPQDIICDYNLYDVITNSRDLSQIQKERRARRKAAGRNGGDRLTGNSKKAQKNRETVEYGLKIQLKEAQAKGQDTTYLESLIAAKSADKASDTDNSNYNYLDTIPLTGREWVTNCYRDILHKIKDEDNSDIVLINSWGHRLHKTTKQLQNDLDMLKRGIIRYNLQNMYIVDAVEYEDEFDADDCNYLAFNIGIKLTDYIDDYDANDIAF